MPQQFLDSATTCVDEIIRKVGNHLVVGTALAAGKPNYLLNEIYRRAKNNPQLQLTILTGLTLEKPKGKSFFEKRFLTPFVDRVFGNYPDLEYELDRVKNKLPTNVKVIEFFFPPGKWKGNAKAQQDYVCSNYTHVVRDSLERGVNIVLAQVAKEETAQGTRYSFSSNPDVLGDFIHQLRRKEIKGHSIAIAAQVNAELPFMYGSALCENDLFDFVVDSPKEYYKIFGPPKQAVGDAEYLIGLYGSALVGDGGELQIGIGALGDALIHSLQLRHKDNETYLQVLENFKILEKFKEPIEKLGGLDPFKKGLFSSTEMFVDGMIDLLREGILKRKVWDDAGLQSLINEGSISEWFPPNILELLQERKIISKELTQKDFDYLQYWGVFQENIQYQKGKLITADGSEALAHIELSKRFIQEKCLGEKLKHGKVIHGGFFLGPQSFYKALKEMPREERELIDMRGVSQINQLYGHEELDLLHRQKARFFNSCLMMTLSGAAVSDGLENGTVVSGIGGQYNFVAMAHALPDGRSILSLRSTRGNSSDLRSNIIWNYGHISIPRHLRDIVITEYGIALLRGKTDSEIIQELLKIADSRFQETLLKTAKQYGKIARDYQIPEVFRNNFPESYRSTLKTFKKTGLFPSFPFGTDLTPLEIEIGGALKQLKTQMKKTTGLCKLAFTYLTHRDLKSTYSDHLERMDLKHPRGFIEKLYQKLLLAALIQMGRKSGSSSSQFAKPLDHSPRPTS